ncbi:MAG: hypothetical protein V3R45_05310 [Candidatus Aminicenantaceae bacterium]
MSKVIAIRDWLVRIVESAILSTPTGGLSLQTQPIPTSFFSPRQKKSPSTFKI